MKVKKNLFMLSLLVLMTAPAFSQVKIFTGNKVLVGADWWGSSYTNNEELFVNGVAGFNHQPALSGIHFMNYPFISGGSTINLMSLIPQWGNTSLIGSSTQQMFQVHSLEMYANSVMLTSDERLKTNVRKFKGSAIEMVLKLNAYRYDFKSDIFTNSHKEMQPMLRERCSNQIGLLAQEVKNVFPEFVKLDEKTDTYSVNYISLIPVLIECIKEQQAQIETLKKEITEIKGK